MQHLQMELPKNLKDEIWEYCRVNNITNIDDFTLKLIKQGFTIEKFGSTPKTNVVEKVVEKIVEVPIEKIVEKIVEVPVPMVDSKLSDELTKQIELVTSTKNELTSVLGINEKLTQELKEEKEKNKNRKDIYGEK